MSFTPGQCRAARALVGWSQEQLATAAKVAKATVANFEAGKRDPYPRTLEDVRAALEAVGIEIILDADGAEGVRLRKRAETVGDLTHRIENLQQAVVQVSESEPASPEKAMLQLRKARTKNEIVELKNRRTKMQTGQDDT